MNYICMQNKNPIKIKGIYNINNKIIKNNYYINENNVLSNIIPDTKTFVNIIKIIDPFYYNNNIVLYNKDKINNLYNKYLNTVDLYYNNRIMDTNDHEYFEKDAKLSLLYTYLNLLQEEYDHKYIFKRDIINVLCILFEYVNYIGIKPYSKFTLKYKTSVAFRIPMKLLCDKTQFNKDKVMDILEILTKRSSFFISPTFNVLTFEGNDMIQINPGAYYLLCNDVYFSKRRIIRKMEINKSIINHDVGNTYDKVTKKFFEPRLLEKDYKSNLFTEILGLIAVSNEYMFDGTYSKQKQHDRELYFDLYDFDNKERAYLTVNYLLLQEVTGRTEFELKHILYEAAKRCKYFSIHKRTYVRYIDYLKRKELLNKHNIQLDKFLNNEISYRDLSDIIESEPSLKMNALNDYEYYKDENVYCKSEYSAYKHYKEAKENGYGIIIKRGIAIEYHIEDVLIAVPAIFVNASNGNIIDKDSIMINIDQFKDSKMYERITKRYPKYLKEFKIFLNKSNNIINKIMLSQTDKLTYINTYKNDKDYNIVIRNMYSDGNVISTFNSNISSSYNVLSKYSKDELFRLIDLLQISNQTINSFEEHYEFLDSTRKYALPILFDINDNDININRNKIKYILDNRIKSLNCVNRRLLNNMNNYIPNNHNISTQELPIYNTNYYDNEYNGSISNMTIYESDTYNNKFTRINFNPNNIIDLCKKYNKNLIAIQNDGNSSLKYHINKHNEITKCVIDYYNNMKNKLKVHLIDDNKNIIINEHKGYADTIQTFINILRENNINVKENEIINYIIN